jgi:TPP-dependent pyruvate/acetoin dehydrogenase alpha subunit
LATTAPQESSSSSPDPEKSVRPQDLLTPEDRRELLDQLYLARYFDVRLIKEKKRGRLRGTLYSSHNQEAIIVGALYGLKSTDWISPIHRDMPAFFMKDLRKGWHAEGRVAMSIQEVCAQVWGRSGSPGRARDNWSHLGRVKDRIICSTSMLAGTIPVAVGVAMADQLNGGDAVVVTFNGEGSTAQGVFHEAINLAAVRRLPVITIIENNQWAYGTPVRDSLPPGLDSFAARAAGFGIPGFVADGQDVLDVFDKVSMAVEHARSGRGPSIVEAVSFRSYGHGDHDDDRAVKYRQMHYGQVFEEEMAKAKERDPILVLKNRLVAMGEITPEQAAAFPAEGKGAGEVTDQDFPPRVVSYMTEGVEYALSSPLPEAEEGGMWVFKESGQ